MHHLVKAMTFGGAALAIMAASPVLAGPHTTSAPVPHQSPWKRTHRVIIQVTQNNPAVMNLALNNAENLVTFYKARGERVEIEIVAYGAGLNMFRSDTSPVKQRLATFADTMKGVTFSGCGNTLAKESRQENKHITLVPEARIVPAGIARVVELEEQGWTYVRP